MHKYGKRLEHDSPLVCSDYSNVFPSPVHWCVRIVIATAEDNVGTMLSCDNSYFTNST